MSKNQSRRTVSLPKEDCAWLDEWCPTHGWKKAELVTLLIRAVRTGQIKIIHDAREIAVLLDSPRLAPTVRKPRATPLPIDEPAPLPKSIVAARRDAATFMLK